MEGGGSASNVQEIGEFSEPTDSIDHEGTCTDESCPPPNFLGRTPLPGPVVEPPIYNDESLSTDINEPVDLRKNTRRSEKFLERSYDSGE